MTSSAIASGRFTSPVGAGRISPEAPGCIADGMKPIQLQIRMKRKSVTPIGTNFFPRGPIAETARSVTCSVRTSQKSCSLLGTPAVIFPRIRNARNKKIVIAKRVDATMSRLMVRPKTLSVGWTPTSIDLAAYSVFTQILLDLPQLALR